MKKFSSSRSRYSLLDALAGLFVGGVLACVAAQAAEADKKQSDATGTWKWTQRPRNNNGQPFEMSVKLKQAGEKLTGVQIGRGGELPIRDGHIQAGKLAFNVVLEFGGGNTMIKYEGTLKGDTIEGKTERNFGGENTATDWVAKREAPKAKKPANLSGTWKWTFTTSAGQTFEPRVRLNHSGDKLAGTVLWADHEAPISDGSFEDEKVSFEVVRERDGRKGTTKYRGKLAGDTIQGKIESDWNGDVQTFDWNAKRVAGQP